jgi:hypothetical protein
MPAASSAGAIRLKSAQCHPLFIGVALSVYPDIAERLAGGALLVAGLKVNGGGASRELQFQISLPVIGETVRILDGKIFWDQDMKLDEPIRPRPARPECVKFRIPAVVVADDIGCAAPRVREAADQ